MTATIPAIGESMRRKQSLGIKGSSYKNYLNHYQHIIVVFIIFSREGLQQFYFTDPRGGYTSHTLIKSPHHAFHNIFLILDQKRFITILILNFLITFIKTSSYVIYELINIDYYSTKFKFLGFNASRSKLTSSTSILMLRYIRVVLIFDDKNCKKIYQNL